MSNEITQEEIIKLMEDRGLTMEKLIDAIIDHNKIIGVGLITLAQTFYLYTFYNPTLRKPNITREEVEAILTKGRRAQFN